MVYCGKPSRACAECRLRRTKCDTLRPSCSQCVRAGRSCKGYRDPADLMFRDESHSVSTKRQGLAGTNKTQVPDPRLGSRESYGDCFIPSSAAIAKPQLHASNPNQHSLLSLGFGTSAEDQATCFFFKNYVVEENESHNGSFQYLSDIYGQQEVGGAVAESVVSLGMVGLANFWKSSNIMGNAKVKYNAALRLVSSRLQNVEEAKSDQTLVAVMLLGLYETNTCSGPQSMESWTKHISGAAALLSLRGKQQLRTPIGQHLFVHLRTQVITNCIQRHVPVPPTIREWSRVVIEYQSAEEAASTRLSEISIKYCNLRASMSSFHDYSDSEYLIASLCAIEAEYTVWISQCPISYIYNTVTLSERSEEVFSDHYHVYSSIWNATVWNYYRCVRILVNELLVDQLSYVLEHADESISLWANTTVYENQLLTSNSTLLHLSHDICSSVPFFLGYSANPSERLSRPPPRAVSGNLLLWPLYIAAVTGMVSEMMRNWVIRQLHLISEVIGIRQAAPLAHTLGLRQDLLEWEYKEQDQIDQSDRSDGIVAVDYDI